MRKTTGPLDTLAVRLPLGSWGPRLEAVAAANSRTLTGELVQAARAWIVQQEQAAAELRAANSQPAALPVVLP
jgi:hypothetical protein